MSNATLRCQAFGYSLEITAFARFRTDCASKNVGCTGITAYPFVD